MTDPTPPHDPTRFLPAFDGQVIEVYFAALELGLRPDLSGGFVLVSRDAMIVANPYPRGRLGDADFIPEVWAYPRTLEVLQSLFPGLRLSWSGKTDDSFLLAVERPVAGHAIPCGVRVETASGDFGYVVGEVIERGVTLTRVADRHGCGVVNRFPREDLFVNPSLSEQLRSAAK